MFDKYSSSFLKDFNFESLLEKFSQKKFLAYKSGDIIYSENSDVSDIYFIISGEVNLCRKSSNENFEIVSTVHPGDVIGFCDALTSKKHSNSAIAVKDTNTFAVSKTELYDITGKNDEFNLWILKYLSSRLHQME